MSSTSSTPTASATDRTTSTTPAAEPAASSWVVRTAARAARSPDSISIATALVKVPPTSTPIRTPTAETYADTGVVDGAGGVMAAVAERRRLVMRVTKAPTMYTTRSTTWARTLGSVG